MNMSIRCQVAECKYNDGNEQYCTLNTIEVVRNAIEEDEGCAHTDCACFETRE